MKKTLAQAARSLENFRLPRYHEIPNVGLYLEQTCQYINEYLELALPGNMTASMISNYVKKGLIDNPVKKQYRREQIAYLFFIAVAKNVLSLDALQYFIQLQQRTYPMERAYNYFQPKSYDRGAVVKSTLQQRTGIRRRKGPPPRACMVA